MNNKHLNTPKPPPPKPSLSKPQLTSPQQTRTRTLQDSLVSGLGFGIGNSIANKLMNNVFSFGTIERPIVKNPPNDRSTCNYLITELDTCILLHEDCNDLFKKLKLHECQYEQYESQKPKIFYDK